MRINTNLPALAAFNSLNSTNKSLEKAIASLSTGLRINSAADDAAGFAISEKIRSQVSGLDTALRNSQDGISMLQTAEGALGETNSMLQRMRELAIQASNDTLTSQDRQYIQLEIDQLKDQVDRIADTTQFNRKRLLDGSCGAMWSSSDPGVKARINGGLVSIDEFGQKVNHEGNYRIEVSAEPGQAQVQKSNPMLIKHKNVTMARSIKNDAGINGISVDNVPIGNYRLEGEPPTEARAFVTGAYGIDLDTLDSSLTANVRNSKLLQNSSILFEVTDVDQEAGTVTLKATAHNLSTDGKNSTVMVERITLKEGKHKDLSSILKLGEEGGSDDAADGAFELFLKSGGAEEFSKGSKFVYNLNVAEDVEGADRVVKFTNTQNPEWPGNWEETKQIYKTNQFQGIEPIDTSSKVLFLIDFSGSMSTPIATVRDNIKDFVNKIKEDSDGISDVQIGIATYVDGLQPHTFSSGSYWSNNFSEIESLLSFSPYGGDVDAYKAIREAVASSDYDMSDVGNRYMVLISDTCQEYSDRHPSYMPRYSSAEFTDLKQAVIDDLNGADIMFSAVRPETLDWEMRYYNAERDQAMQDFDPIISATGGVALNQRDVANWGKELVSTLGTHIGADVWDSVNGIPLYQFKQFADIFPTSSSAPHTLIIEQDGKSTPIDIEPTDTLATLASKIDAACGSETKTKLHDGDDEQFVSINSVLTDKGKLTFSGSEKLINILGLRSNLEMKFSLDASEVKNKDIHFRQFYINPENGKVYDSDIVMTTDDETELHEWGMYSEFEAAYIGQIPKHDVQLKDINNFWDSQGVFMLEQPQTITITQGDGTNTSITLYKTDTVEDVRKKINNAIAYDLGQSKYVNDNRFASFVKSGDNMPQGDESVAGTFVIRSAIPGKDGELSFSGDQSILRALGFSNIQDSSESIFTASVYDAHSGKAIATDVQAAGTEFKGLIPPAVDIEVDAMAGISADWDDNTKRFILGSQDVYSAFIHLKNNGTVLQTGANSGEDFMLELGDSSTSALGLSRVNVLTRESASRSVNILDRAINTIASQRAKIGAYSNALEHTMTDLTAASSNLTTADSRLRDADMASTMMDFVKLQILNQSGTSMLAQANQLPQSVLSLLGN